jgi:spore coat polysaccharide biosynthesis predicted glycosyltransferase SpsG
VFLGNYEAFATEALETYQIDFIRLVSPDFSTLLPSYIGKPDLAVFDSYLITQAQLDHLASCNFKSIIVDDSCTLNFEGLFGVINFRLDAENLYRYDSRYSFLGIEFFVVKPEIVNLRAKSRTFNQNVRKVLLFTGGSLSDARILSAIADCIREVSDEIEITHIGHVCLARTDNYRHIYPSPHIENYLADCDVAVNAGGLIKYESAFSLTPTASFSTTRLQLDDSIILDVKGLHCNLGDVENIDNRQCLPLLSEVLLDKDRRNWLVQNSRQFFGDNPTLHLIKEIENIL